MKVVTVAGTRPELIRLSRIIPALDAVCDHHFVWTDQNHRAELSEVFFETMQIRRPDEDLGIGRRDSAMGFVGALLQQIEASFKKEQPDKVLILGDTNSALSAFVAKRMGIPVYHMEAGNRCYDDRVPEEVNRKVIDACSAVLLPYTNRSRDNLLAEGYPARKIMVTGNPIWEVLEHYKEQRKASCKLPELGLAKGGYFLVTLHRAENVDDVHNLKWALDSLRLVRDKFPNFPMVVSTHPRTKDKLRSFGLKWDPSSSQVDWNGITWLDPLNLHEFTSLEEDAALVLTDSGTVQEEACLFGVPTVTLRNTTERPETVQCGSNVVTGLSPDKVLNGVRAMLGVHHWQYPEGYKDPFVSGAVARILMSEVPV